jgi:hypothetical protein
VTRSSSSLANVENTPVKIVSTQKSSHDVNVSNRIDSSRNVTDEPRIVEETPIKDDDHINDVLPTETMAREIQRLSLRLRSSTPRKHVQCQANNKTFISIDDTRIR